ncbi:MAG: hypothetical protein H8E03_00900 [Pelagibacteraceae bacterium]|nr:hypothetical protein [Pelagibacteraceae bacterium]
MAYEFSYSPTITKSELYSNLVSGKFDCIFTNPNKQNFMLDAEVLKNTNVKIICTASTGTNHIDKKYCDENDIEIISITDDHDVIDKISSTAEHSLALMLSLIRNIPIGFHSVRDGNWDWGPYVGRQMNSLTIGIIGYGRLGKLMAKYCHALGMTVLVYDPYDHMAQWAVGNTDATTYSIHVDMFSVELEELFNRSDVISLHVHVTDETREMINRHSISQMNNSPYLINTSRGEIVNEADVIDGLNNGKLTGYATDVVVDEFSDIRNSKLVKESIEPNKNIIITPHIAGMTTEAREIAYNLAVDKLEKRYG